MKEYRIKDKPEFLHGIEMSSFPVKMIRLPMYMQPRVTENVWNLAQCTIGGRIRFTTDSEHVKIKITIGFSKLDHAMSLLTAQGADVYITNDKNETRFGARVMPVIFISKPDFDSNPTQNRLRRDVIIATFAKAVENGDKNVYFIDGATLFGKEDRVSCTIDGCHPNDLGFMKMAETIYPVLKNVLENK